MSNRTACVTGDRWYLVCWASTSTPKRMSALFFFPRHIWSAGRIHFISSLIKLVLSTEEEQQLKCFVMSQQRRPDEAWTATPDGRWRRCRMRRTTGWWCVCVFVYVYEEDRDKYKTEIKMGIVAQIDILSRLFCWVHGKCLANKNWTKTIAS